MKKIMAVLTVLMCFASASSIAQEVRGIETKRVIYQGERSYTYNSTCRSNEYFGFEFTNMNSISVSVDIELYDGFNGDRLIKTKTVVLKSGETYILKTDLKAHKFWDGTPGNVVDEHYVKYKAFKLQ